MTEVCDVLVVGSDDAGPVLAADLRRAGVNVLLTSADVKVLGLSEAEEGVDVQLEGSDGERADVRAAYVVRDTASPTRAGRLFEVGDEADAHNLAWKLAAVLGGAGADLLDTYLAERERGAKNYRDSRLSQELGGKRLKLRAGDRVPDVLLWSVGTGLDVPLGSLVNGPHWTLLGLGSRSAEVLGALSTRFGQAVHTEVIGGGGSMVPGVTLQDRYGQARHRLARRGGTVLVVRPDGYLGLRSAPNVDIIAAYLEDLVSAHEAS
ncbi:FAD-dependent monooxygenase [Flindersiella endophytica]